MARLSKDQHALLTAAVDRWLKKYYRDPIDLPALAQEIGITRFLLCRLYRERSGKTIRLKQREIRINHAGKLLASGAWKVSDVAREVGYGSMSHFTKAFLEEKGALPSTWKSRPRIISVPETAGSFPPPGLTFVTATIGEVPPELSHGSGKWDPAGPNSASRAAAPPRPKRSGRRWHAGNAFAD